MAAGDAAWWHMDREANRLVVTSVMWFDEPLDAGAVRAVLRDRLLTTYPRFSQRVVESPRGVWWEDVDEDADTLIAAHLVEAKLPAPGGMPELQSFVSTVVNRRLDGDRPLWQAYLLGGFRGTGAALVTRIHHCVADGIALARVLLSLTDDATSGVVTDERPVSSTPLAAVASLPGAVLAELVHPRRLASDVLDVATAAREVARLVALPPDHRTALRGALGIHKAALWSEPISLERLRRRAHAAGGTVNDVVLAGLSGALRDHVARLDGDVRDIRVIVPVNVRPAEQPLPATLGNAFGLLFVALPVGIDDPAERLREVRRRTEALKSSPEPLVSFRLLELTGYTPYLVQQLFVEAFTSKASGVVTNVPGPRGPVFLAGRRLRGMVAWPPESGTLGIGVSVISYDGEVVLGLLADEQLVPDPRRLLGRLVDEVTSSVTADAG